MPVGKNVTFSPLSFFSCGKTSVRHVPDIDEIVTSPHTGRQFTVEVVGNHLNQVVVRRIVGAKDAGRLHHYGIQPFPYGLQHQLGGFSFGLGIAPNYCLRGKILNFFQYLKLFLFRNGMDGTDIDQAFHIFLPA